MNTLWKTYGNRMGTYENLWGTYGKYENLWKPMKSIWTPYGNLCNLMKTYEKRWKPMETNGKAGFSSVSLHITRRGAPRRTFEWFYCILRGAKPRSEIFERFTAYCAARSAAAKFWVFYCILRGAKRRGENLNISSSESTFWLLTEHRIINWLTRDPLFWTIFSQKVSTCHFWASRN